VPEDDKTSRKHKRKLKEADHLDVNNSKQQRTSSEIESKKDDISSVENELSFPNVAADSAVSGRSLVLVEEKNQADNVNLTSEEMTEPVDVAKDEKEDITEESLDVESISDTPDVVDITDEYAEYEIKPLEKADVEEDCEVISDTDFEAENPACRDDDAPLQKADTQEDIEVISDTDTEMENLAVEDHDAPYGDTTERVHETIPNLDVGSSFYTGFDTTDDMSLPVTEAHASAVDTVPVNDRCLELIKIDEDLQCGDKGHVDSEMSAASELVGLENPEKSVECTGELDGFSSAVEIAASTTEILPDILVSGKDRDVSKLNDKDGENHFMSDGANLSSDDAVLKEQDVSYVQSTKQEDKPSLEICDLDQYSSTGEATENAVACQSLMPLSEDLELSSQSAVVDYTESSTAAEHGLSTEAEPESAELCMGSSSGDQHDVSVSEQMSESVMETDGGDTDNHLLASSTDVTRVSADDVESYVDDDHGLSTGEATERAIACQSLMLSAEDLELTSQSAVIDYTEGSMAAEHDMQMELCSSSGDQHDLSVSEQVSESVTETDGYDSEGHLLASSINVTDDVQSDVDDDHSSSTGEATERAIACQSLILSAEDLELTSQSAVIDYTEGSMAAEHDIQTEVGTSGTEAAAQNAELCSSSGDQHDDLPVTVCEQVSENVVEMHGDNAEESLPPISTDVACISAAATVDHGSSSGEATEKAVACQSFVPLTVDLELSSQSTVVSYTAAEHEQMEGGTLSTEAEAESAELCKGSSSGDQHDVSVSEQMSESITETDGDDTDSHLLPSSTDVTRVSADDVDDDHGLSTGEATEQTLVCPGLMLSAEDLDSSSQSTIVDYTESSMAAEHDMQTEVGTSGTEAAAQGAELSKVSSSGDQHGVAVSEQGSERVTDTGCDDTDDHLLPTSTDVTPAAVAVADDDDSDDDFEVEML